MTTHNCWICKGVDRFIFKVLPWALGVLAIFSAGFYTRCLMAKPVLVTITWMHQDTSLGIAHLRLRTDQLSADRDLDVRNFDTPTGDPVLQPVDHVQVKAERELDN
jgi:hypothetical protein